MIQGHIMRINKFVLDNNIWVSYLITHREELLIDIIDDNELTIFSCNELLEEVSRVLAYTHLKKYGVDIQYALNVVKSMYRLNYVPPYRVKSVPLAGSKCRLF